MAVSVGLGSPSALSSRQDGPVGRIARLGLIKGVLNVGRDAGPQLTPWLLGPPAP